MGSRTLWSWGANSDGQLGLEDRDARSSPEQVGSLSNWSFVTCGGYHTATIKTDGTLWIWGDNNNYGQLGLEDIINRSSPEQVGALTNWSSVAGGYYHTIAIKTDGTLWAVGGFNTNGQLGREDTAHRSSPEQVGSLEDWSSVVGGPYHNTAIKTDGTLWSWGYNGYGELGLGDTFSISIPVQVGALTDWSSVSCGYDHTTAIKIDGTLWSWGKDDYGQLGQETVDIHLSSPEQVGSLTDWSYIDCGWNHSTAIKTDGTLWAWGDNEYGQLGLEDVAHRSSPEQVGSLTDWSDVNCGSYCTTAIKTNGTLWIWGRNSQGQLGLEDQANRSSPEQVGALTNWSYVDSGLLYTLAIQADKSIIEDISLDSAQGDVCWGHATYSDIEEDVARPLGAWSGSSELVGTGDEETLEMDVGEYQESESWEVGTGECGIDINKYRTGSDLTPTIKYKTGATEAECEAEPTLWSWGFNEEGQLGQEDIDPRSSPEQVGALTGWGSATTGYYHTIVTKTDGTLWSWGLNTNGQLGQEDAAHRSSPEQVGFLTDWSDAVVGGAYHTLAVKTDGTLWTWGLNDEGQLGLEDWNVHRSSPEQVGDLTNWRSVTGGAYHTAAVKTDGSLWTWGYDAYGQLGLGSTNDDRSSPEQVGLLTNWSSVSCGDSHTTAVKTNGTLWSWGRNSNGRLGLGDVDFRSSPVQVGLLTDWSSVDCGNYHTLAIKTDGTVWSWGDNDYGQLGQEDIDNRSSPEQVGLLTDWSSVVGGDYDAAATKTDGTLWAWGINTYGELGQEDIADKSSPEQVGGLTNWSSVAGGGYHIIAVKNQWRDYNGVSFESQGWVKVRLES